MATEGFFTVSSQGTGIMRIFIILLPFLLVGPSSATIIFLNATFNTTANLPCDKPCSGDVKWKKETPQNHQIAVCKNGNCTVNPSLKKRFTFILSGTITLLVQQAVLGDEGWYEVYCGETVICDVKLKLLAHDEREDALVGDPLVISLLSSEPVRVTFRKSGLSDSTDKSVCIVENDVPLCVREYAMRASVTSHSLKLANVAKSDVGIFNVTHMETKRVLNTINVTVKDELEVKVNTDGKDTVSDSRFLFAPYEIILVIMTAFILGFFFWPIFWRCIAFVSRYCEKCSNRVQKSRKRHHTQESSFGEREKKDNAVNMELMTSDTS